MAAGIRNGNASKAAWICALLIVFVQLSGVKCGGNAAEKQRTLESGIPSSDPTFPYHSGPIPVGNEIASSSHASSRRGGGRRDLLGGELAGIIVGAVGTVVMIGGLIWLAKRDIEQARQKVRGAPVVTATLGFESPVKSPPAPSRAPATPAPGTAPPAPGTAPPRPQAFIHPPMPPHPGIATPRPTGLATPLPQPPIPPTMPPPAGYAMSGVSSLVNSVQLPASISMAPRVTYGSPAPQQPLVPAVPVGSAAGNVVPDTTVFL